MNEKRASGTTAVADAADALLLDASDDVATALRPLAAGTASRVRSAAGDLIVKVIDVIPTGHKVAIRDVGQGCAVRKQGEVIGAARVDIKSGEHVHVHNLVSLRGK